MRPLGRTDFDAAFTPDTVFRDPQLGDVRVRQVEIGEIVLSSGQVVACDPSNLVWDAIPFARAVPPGRYPATLCITDVRDQPNFDRRVACALVRLTPEKPSTWQLALRPGQDVSGLPAGKFFGYSVDAGMGCFVDSKAFEALSKDAVEKLYEDRVFAEIEKSGGEQNWWSITINETTGDNLLFFDSGFGDGAYPSFWGLDRTGKPCRLVTDFGILVEHIEGRSTFLIGDWVGKPVFHPDLSKIGLSIRLIPIGDPPTHRLRVEMEGASCKVVISNAGKEYSSDRLSLYARGGYSEYDFRFEEPLLPDARVALEYGLGVQALETVR